jgi:methionyl-tRNA formyltransferase
MRAIAEQSGITTLAPDDINADALRPRLREFGADLFVVCDYGQILAADTLAIPRLGGINLHGSLLPKYRGAAPVNWAILEGEQETGVTVIHMTPKLDAGPQLVRRQISIAHDETAAELEPRLAQLGVEAVCESLELLEAWDGTSPLGQPQEGGQATRAPRLRKSDGRVDWARTAQQISNQVRGLKPWPGTYAHLERGKGPPLRLILERVLAHPDWPLDAAPGSVVLAEDGRLCIATGEGVLEILRIQPAGKRVMDVDEFLRGHPLQVGERFCEPPV